LGKQGYLRQYCPSARTLVELLNDDSIVVWQTVAQLVDQPAHEELATARFNERNRPVYGNGRRRK
jgi:hypothetical protein